MQLFNQFTSLTSSPFTLVLLVSDRMLCVYCSVHSSTADYIPVDLSKESNIDAYVREIRKVYPHGVDILVNNAGNCVMNTACCKLM